jgi:hypothetical protein
MPTSTWSRTSPGGALDGIVGRPGGPWTPVIEHVDAAADLGWDARRRRLLIPRLETGGLDIVSVP